MSQRTSAEICRIRSAVLMNDRPQKAQALCRVSRLLSLSVGALAGAVDNLYYKYEILIKT